MPFVVCAIIKSGMENCRVYQIYSSEETFSDAADSARERS